MKLHITKRHNELVETEYELPVYLYFQDEFSNDTLVKVFEGNNGKLSAITVCHENFSFSITQEALYLVEDIRLESCITTEKHFNEMYEEALMMFNTTVYGCGEQKYKFNREQAEASGFIESMIANTWFREDTESLFSATKDGFVKISGSKEDLPKDKDGNIVLNKTLMKPKN
jgi:hypothetical protein